LKGSWQKPWVGSIRKLLRVGCRNSGSDHIHAIKNLFTADEHGAADAAPNRRRRRRPGSRNRNGQVEDEDENEREKIPQENKIFTDSSTNGHGWKNATIPGRKGAERMWRQASCLT